jgi:hypothetical protein
MYYLFLDDIRNPKDAFCYDDNKTLSDLSSIPNGAWEVVRSFDEFKRMIDTKGLPLVVSFDCDLTDEHVNYFLKNCDVGIYEWENFTVKCGIHCAKYLKSAMGENRVEVFTHSANHIGRKIIREIFAT